MEKRQPSGFPIMISETNPKREEIVVRGRQSTNVWLRGQTLTLDIDPVIFTNTFANGLSVG
jgi:hypothetical protein